MLAVLPFVNLSGDPAQEYFVDGLTEEMITDLGCLNPQALGVIARTSAMKYKNTNEDIAQIGRELGVTYILEGSVRREGNQARISAQLIQVSDQTHVWAQNYELQVKDILEVQNAVAATIAGKIKINLRGQQPQLAQAQLANPEAYDDYLHGRYLLSQRSKAGFREAVKFFSQAIAKDPSFALAYAGLADSDVLLSFADGDPSAGAKTAALRALALDENLAEAHTSLAAVDILDWNWKDAEKEFRRALALNPNYATAHHWYGDLYLSPMGRPQEAIAELKQAQELDPLSLIVNTDLGYAYYFAGQYDHAFSQYQKVLAVDPSFISVHWDLAPYYEQRGMYDQWAREFAEVNLLNGSPDLAQQIKSVYAAGGRQKLLEFIVASEHKGLYFEKLVAASAAASLGNKEEALQCLEEAYRIHHFNLLRLKADPAWNSLRPDPRFQDLERRIGLN
jgi:TolB-like protein